MERTDPGTSVGSSSQIAFLSGVFAAKGVLLKRDCISKSIPTREILSQNSTCRIHIRISTEGYLKPIQKCSTWIRNVKLSPDIRSYNAILELDTSKDVRLRICKDVDKEQEIIMWFSEEIVALIGIPFLTPANIRGNNCYSCHFCNVCFETPNPLKIHLALSCAQQSIDFLWVRLHCAVNETRPRDSMEIVRPQQPKPLGHNYRHSAFRPITPSFYTTSMPPMGIVSQVSTEASVSAAAQIETIVSNMGASKQGHLCIYCGKIYSRKYGLKIHIRTHTGFKPLKCKFCFRPFGDPSNLNKHVRLHTENGSAIFKCHICNKVLARRRDLQRHMQTRHCNRERNRHTSSEDESLRT